MINYRYLSTGKVAARIPFWGIRLVAAPNVVLSVRLAQLQSYCRRDKILRCESLKFDNIFRNHHGGGGGVASRSRFSPK